MNFADNCIDRHLDAGRGEQPALIWEGDDGRSRTLTYRELAREVNQLANALKRLGVGEGDRVGVFLPMSPEAAIATLAIVRIGAIYTPCFSGYGAQAVASRLQDCEATVLITADGFYRRGQVVKMKETADEAAARVPVDPARHRVQAARPRDPVDRRPRPLVARADRAASRMRARRCRSSSIARASSSTRRGRPAARRARCSRRAASCSSAPTTSAT